MSLSELAAVDVRRTSPPTGGRRVSRRFLALREGGGLVSVALVFLGLPLLLNTVGGARWESIGTTAAIWAVAAVGLDVVWGLAGHISLGQQGFIALGAYMTAVSTATWGWRPEFGILLGVLVGVLLSLLIGVIVLRLEEGYLALATLGIGYLIPALFNAWDWAGSAGGVYGVPNLELFGFEISNDSLYWAAWTTAGIAAAALLSVRSRPTGLAWRTLAQSVELAESCGVAARRKLNAAFALSALLGAVSGAIFSHYSSAISPATFSPFVLIILLTSVVVGGLGTVVGAGLGAIMLTLLVSYSAEANHWAEVIFGVALGLMLLVAPRGLLGLLRTLMRCLLGQRYPAIIASQPAHGTPGKEASTPIIVRPREDPAITRKCNDAVLLDVRDTCKNFGGVTVLEDVNLQIRRSEIHGLVGPNGAGKSTLLNIISGVLAPNGGEVYWLGERMNGVPAWRRSRAGIGRTFQKPLVVPNLTVVENIALGSVLRTGPALRRISMTDHLERAADAGSRLGLGKVLNMDGGALGFSGQRIVEIARALVGDPMLICLDEATSGLDANERREIREVLETVRARAVALCVVEHDTELIATLCDRVTVLDHGVVIAQESGEAVFKDRGVIESYFGERPQTRVNADVLGQN